ncbi:VCBS repeat [Shimia thalassica]|uniref:VCBS repeat n=1 Tax=Shimia thalassica TaxID=1715693 RepID=A0A0P1IEF2_9RHOB|nr:VCBS repeat [Shimia thalassica]
MISRTKLDTRDQYTWAERVTVFDSRGFRISETTTYDDGRVRVATFEETALTADIWSDPHDNMPWTGITRTYDSSTGRTLTRVALQDDGQSINSTFANGNVATREVTDTHDVASSQSITELFDAAGRISEKIKVQDDGRVTHTYFADGVRTHRIVEDRDDTKPWARQEYTFEEATGRLVSVKTVFDDGQEETQLSFARASGSTSVQVDTDNVHKWHTTTSSFDDRGDMVSQERVFDDGRTQATQFEDGVKATSEWADVGNVYSWTSKSVIFDGAGRLLSTSQAMDDDRLITATYIEGTRQTYAVTDLGDAHGWATKSKSFDAQGRISELVVVYDDGRLATTTYVSGVKQNQSVLDLDDVYGWARIYKEFNGPGGAKLFTQRTSDDGQVSVVDARGREIITGGTEATVTEDATPLLEASGQLQIVADYLGHTDFVPSIAALGDAGLGHFTLAVDGSWAYVANSNQRNIQALGTGDSLTDSFSVRTVDGVTAQVSVTIQGVTDGPEPIYVGGAVIGFGEAGDLAIAAPTLDLTQFFADEQGDALTITAAGLDPKYSIANNVLRFTNPADFALNGTAGDSAITLTALDATGQNTSVSVTLATGMARSYGDGILSSFAGLDYTSGDDRLEFGNGAGENGFLAMRLGAGDDSAQFGHFAADDGEMLLDAGDGNDSVVFGDDAGRSTDGFGLGELNVNLGAGDDAVRFGMRVGLGGAGTQIHGGVGRDSIIFDGSTANALIDLGVDGDADSVLFNGALDKVVVRNWQFGEDTIALTGSNGGMWVRSDAVGNAYFQRFDGSNFMVEGAAGIAAQDIVSGLTLNHAPTYVGGVLPISAGSIGSTGHLAFDLATLFRDADISLRDELHVTLETVPAGFDVSNNVLRAIDPADLSVAGDYTLRATARDLHGASVTQDISLRLVLDHAFADSHNRDPFVVLGTLGGDEFTIPGTLRQNASGTAQPFAIQIDTLAGEDTIAIGDGLDTVTMLDITDLAGSTTLTIGDRVNAQSPVTTIALSTHAEDFSAVTIGDGFSDDAQASLSGRGSFRFGDSTANNYGAITLDVAGDIAFGSSAGAQGGAIEVVQGSFGARNMTFGTGAENLTLAFGASGIAETLTFEGMVSNATISNFEAGLDQVIVSGPTTFWSAFDVAGDKLFLDERGSNFTVLGAAGIAADLLAPELVNPGQDLAVLFKAMQDSFVFAEDDVLTGTLLDNDLLVGTPVTVTLLDQGTADGSLVVNPDGRLSYMTARQDLWEGYRDTVQFIYGITNADGLTSQATAEITIEGANDAPEMADAEMDVFDSVLGPGVGGTFVLDLSTLGSDPDGDDNGQTLTYTVTSGSAGSLATVHGTELRVFPGATWRYLDSGQTRTHDLEITATDRHGASTTSTVTLNVVGADNAPYLGFPGFTILEDNASLLDVLAGARNIDEGDTFALTEILGTHNGSAVIENGQIRYTPFDDFWGEGWVRYKVVDSDGLEAIGRARINVLPDPDAPLLSFQTFGSRLGDGFGLIVRAETTDFEQEPENNFVGIDRFELVARDADGNLIENFSDYVFTTEWDTPLNRTNEAYAFRFNLPDDVPTDWDIEVTAVARDLDGREASTTETFAIEFDTTHHHATQTFEIGSQNIWNSADGERFTASETFGGSFNEAGGTTATLVQFDHRLAGVGVSTHFSTRLDGEARGNIGVTASTGIEGGSVSGTAAFDTTVTTSILRTDAGTTLNFNTRAIADPGAASFVASAPKLDFDLSVTELDLYASFAARLWGYLHFHLAASTVKPVDRGDFYDGWAFGAVAPLDANPLLGADGRSIVNFDGIDTVQFLEFGPTTQDLSGSYTDPFENRLLDYVLGTTNFTNQATGSSGSLLSGEFSQTFADLTLDLDSIAASIIGKRNPLGFVKQESQGPFSYGYHYDLLDLDLSFQAAYRQANSLDLRTLDGTIVFEDGSEVDFVFGDAFGLNNAQLYDEGGDNDGIIEYNILMRPTARFNSDAYVDLSVFDLLSVLGASVNGGVNGGDYYGVSTPGFGISRSVGPVYSHRGLMIDESSSITLAQRSFELDVGTAVWSDLFA